MADQMGQMQDQGDQTDQADEQDDKGIDYCIEIRVMKTGQVMVGVESGEQEAQEEQDNGEEDQLTPAKSIKDALSMALDIYRSGGEMPNPEGNMEEMNSGYSGKPMKQATQNPQGGM